MIAELYETTFYPFILVCRWPRRMLCYDNKNQIIFKEPKILTISFGTIQALIFQEKQI